MPVNVISFGADPSGVNDSTVAVQTALSTGQPVYLPAGTYKIGAQLVCGYSGQEIFGDGRNETTLVAQPGFTGSGVFIVACPEPGPSFHDFHLTCIQPDTAIRGELHPYPPAFQINAVPRVSLRDVRISLFQSGVVFSGNCGGSWVERVESGCLSIGISIDGSLDIMRINQFHCWPFGSAGTKRMGIWQDAYCTGIYSGRCDGLMISDSMFINGGWHISLNESALGPTFGNVSNTGFDTSGAVAQVGKNEMSYANCYWSAGVQEAPWLRFAYNSGGILTLTGGRFDDFSNQQPGPYVHTSNGGRTVITGNFIRRPAGAPPVVYADTGSRVSFTGNLIDNHSSNPLTQTATGGVISNMGNLV